ncbi:MAG: alpha-L-arabinofuranosidase, partial [Chitinophagaceae bacterium]
KTDFIDEHYYRSPEWFLQNARRYDNYPSDGSKIFAGEYAAQSDRPTSANNVNSWLTSISEAAFMTGLERNAGVVEMASYAPLFAHADGWQWTPDLIWVNNLQAYGTPDYQVQKLFSLYKGTRVLPITLNSDVVAGQDSLYASACMDEKTNELIIKLVNASGKQQDNTIEVQGIKKLATRAMLTTLKADPASRNSFDQPKNISPIESEQPINGRNIKINSSPYSFTVVRVKMR